MEAEGGEDVKAQRSDDRDGMKRGLTLDERLEEAKGETEEDLMERESEKRWVKEKEGLRSND